MGLLLLLVVVEWARYFTGIHLSTARWTLISFDSFSSMFCLLVGDGDLSLSLSLSCRRRFRALFPLSVFFFFFFEFLGWVFFGTCFWRRFFGGAFTIFFFFF